MNPSQLIDADEANAESIG